VTLKGSIGLSLIHSKAECKAAKQQSLDLQRAQQHIDAILATETQPSRKDSSQKTSPIEKTKAKDSFRGRFSDPPAPPPQAPLPEKPDAALHRGIGALAGTFQPSLARSDTERPKLPTSKSAVPSTSEAVASATQFASLMDQLNKARQEVETERTRLRETEDLLVQERVKREDAEERAKRLEGQRTLHVPPSPVKSEESTTPIDDEQQDVPKEDLLDAKKLQERFDLLLAEFNEYKIAADQWRAEKEQAEKERDEEKKQRLSLMEMIEKIQSEEAAGRSPKRKTRGRRRSRSKSMEAPALGSRDGTDEDPTAGDEDAEDADERFANGTLEKKTKATQNGHPVVSQKGTKGSDQSDTRRTLARRDFQLTEAAPYLSAISVVMIGVAVMALLNKMQRGESLKS
jgi:hypothetical protein